MIPLGVLASAYVAPAGGGGVSIVQSKYAASNTLTLDAAPTPGNLLVVGGANGVTTPASWTYSHTLTLDVAYEQAGWDAAMASGIVQSGDSATVTITGMNASYAPHLTVWEIAGASGLVDSDAVGDGAYATSLALSVTSGAVVLAAAMFSANISSPSATDMTTDGASLRAFFASAVTPAQPFSTTISWATGRNAAAVLGAYS